MKMLQELLFKKKPKNHNQKTTLNVVLDTI